jgi:hypothetical protein
MRDCGGIRCVVRRWTERCWVCEVLLGVGWAMSWKVGSAVVFSWVGDEAYGGKVCGYGR